MTKKRSETATGKRAGPGASRAAHLLLGLLLIVAGGAAVQVLGASATQEPIPAAAASATSPPTHGQVVSPATVAGNSAQTLNVYGGRMRPLVTVESGEIADAEHLRPRGTHNRPSSPGRPRGTGGKAPIHGPPEVDAGCA